MVFDLSPIPVTHFGHGTIELVPAIVARYGKKALFVTGKQSFIKTNAWEMLLAKCEKLDIRITHEKVGIEPTPELVDEIVGRNKTQLQDVIVAIGGGSVIDAAKAISAMLCEEGSVADFLEGVGKGKPSGNKIPYIAIPTTAGTGAEATKNAVISQLGENGFKRSLRHDNYVPNVALLDPHLTASCTPLVTAQSGMDAFTQLLESYLSTKSSPITDALAVDGIRKVRDGLYEAFRHGANLTARSNMAYAAYLSGITLANAGLGTVHGFASSIGGFFDIPHGLICARMMASVNRITVKKIWKTRQADRTALKYARIGKLFSADKNRSDDYFTELLLDLIDQWTGEFGIKTLSQCGVRKDDFKRIIAQTSNKNNPVALDEEELSEALELAF